MVDEKACHMFSVKLRLLSVALVCVRPLCHKSPVWWTRHNITVIVQLPLWPHSALLPRSIKSLFLFVHVSLSASARIVTYCNAKKIFCAQGGNGKWALKSQQLHLFKFYLEFDGFSLTAGKSIKCSTKQYTHLYSLSVHVAVFVTCL